MIDFMVSGSVSAASSLQEKGRAAVLSVVNRILLDEKMEME